MANRYERLLVHIFEQNYEEGADSVEFDRDDIESAAEELAIKLPKNLGDVVYSFRYRRELPDSIVEKAPPDKHWIIRGAGRAKYRLEAVSDPLIVPNELIGATKVPDATPNIIGMYALSDEQALLAKLRYNRLIDVFTGVTCYSLQNHLRTTVPNMGQVETDEIYIGVDRRGAPSTPVPRSGEGRDRPPQHRPDRTRLRPVRGQVPRSDLSRHRGAVHGGRSHRPVRIRAAGRRHGRAH